MDARRAPRERPGARPGSGDRLEGLIAEGRLLADYARALRPFLRRPLSLAEARAEVERRLRGRVESFLDVFERGIASNPASPYSRLLDRAGVEPGDVTRLVREEGLEDALGALHDAGVYVTLDEFNGRTPIRRGSLELEVRAADFDNPLGRRHYRTHTGGSTGSVRPILIDLGMTEHEARYLALVLAAFGIGARPFAFWFPVPPGVAGMKALLVNAKLGSAAERWFSQTRPDSSRSRALTLTTVAVARAAGVRLPFPEVVRPSEARRVVEWLARSAPALLSATPSSAARLCVVAEEAGIDLAGSVFWLGGEPFTLAKAELLATAGATAFSNYYFTEIGQLGLACVAGDEVDDVHLATDTVAAVERPAPIASGGAVDALYYTSLLDVSPKLALNVESGDCASLEERSCGCLLDEVGYGTHLSRIRSYEKLVTEGMNFLAIDLIAIVEELLPARFGGRPTDYQLVETEGLDGRTKVELLVSPRVGPVVEPQVVAAVLAALGAVGGPQAMMADVWREAGTLAVVRAEPIETRASKILPLHVVRAGDAARVR